MALLFDADSEQVNLGSGSTLDSIAAGTVIVIFRPSAVSGNHHFYRKNGTQFSRFLFNSAGNLELGKERAGVDCQATTNTAPVTANVWQVAACTWNLAGANGDQHIYHGALGGAITEPTYAAQQVGDSAHDDSAGNWIIGHNGTTGVGAFRGEIARQLVFARQLTLGEVSAVVYGPALLSGCVAHHELGWNGTGTQPDYSGNGNAGTVTGATLATGHAPLGSPFGPEEGWPGLPGTGRHPTIAPHSPLGEWDEPDWEGLLAPTGGGGGGGSPWLYIRFMHGGS